jgi:ABC-type branched-subunit amino acid transport system substrate-binding protein
MVFKKNVVGDRTVRGRALVAAIATLLTASVAAQFAVIAGAGASKHHSASLGNTVAKGAPIVIGFDSDESGPNAVFGLPASQAFKAYFLGLNAHGGLDGHKFNVIVLDDKSDPSQQLLNWKTLWQSDKAIAIAGDELPGLPYTYIKAQQIPAYTSGGDPTTFSSELPTLFTDGGQTAQWGAQTAGWLVHTMHRHPKAVAVIYTAEYSGFNDYIASYWHKLGVKNVTFTPDVAPNGDCSANVEKWKAQNVQYIDIQGFDWPQCITAEQRLKWTPVDGQGGAFTSEESQAELVGPAVKGVVTGSPNTSSDGTPIYNKPTPTDLTYVANMKAYSPKFSDPIDINSNASIYDYTVAQLIGDVIKGVIAKYGTLNSANMIKYTSSLKNYNDGFLPTVASFSQFCKTGADGTVWGFWGWNPNKKPHAYQVFVDPQHSWSTDNYLGLGQCGLTKLANKLLKISG